MDLPTGGLRELMGEDSETIQSLDDLSPNISALLILGYFPAALYFLNWAKKYFNFGGYVLSKGNRFRWWELLLVVGGFSIDDTCTAIGMQAEEKPLSHVEVNTSMSGLMQFWIQNGLAKTETAAHRLTYISFMVMIFGFHYMGWLTANSRLYLLFMGALKAWAGYGWCQIEPNNFTHADFFTFKDGRPTPERMSIPLGRAYNQHHGYVAQQRRRLSATKNTGAAWIQRFLYTIFPV